MLISDFGVLLSGRTSNSFRHDDILNSPVTNSAYNYVITGRFTFFRKNLYFSFLGSAATPRPRNIQFIDNKGSIIEEQTINPTGGAYQNATGKLCGVWRRVPRDYRKLLREEGLYVSLIWDSTNSLIGQLSRFKGLASEQFSVLLEPADGADR